MILYKTAGNFYRVGLDAGRKETIRLNLIRTGAENSMRVNWTESK
jgi:hypothetical protein